MSERSALLSLIGAGKATAEGALARRDAPEFRKASLPMLLAVQAVEEALAHLSPGARAAAPTFGLVVGVDHGELEITKEFLCTLANRGIARPFLFQSALHNATLGFLSMHFGLMGPGLTTSTHDFAGEDALTLATDLVTGGDCEACICVGVEAIDDAMVSGVMALRDDPRPPASGAGAVILASAAFAARHASAANLRLGAVRCSRRPVDERARPEADFYGAHAVEQVALAWLAARPTALKLQKPRGASSAIELLAASL